MGLKLSIDSGGSKVLAVLFDQDFQLLGFGSGEGGNVFFDTHERITAAFRQCLAECLAPFKDEEIEVAYITALFSRDIILDLIQEWCPVGQVQPADEGITCLLAGVQKDQGLVALAGTGSTLFALNGGKTEAVAGGWGSWIGDEGSGYYIGRRGIEAAIKDSEGRGPATAITSLLVAHYELNGLRDLTYKLYNSPSPRSWIASVSKLVSQAARQGDSIAKGILSDAGAEMAEQALALLRRYPDYRSRTVTIAGGAWKSGREMFETFRTLVHAQEPELDLRVPLFEPVMGGVVAEALREAGHEAAKGTGMAISPSRMYDLTTRFSRFLYRVDWD